MERVHRRQEGGADAERDERLRDLVRNEAGLADAGEEDGAGGVKEGAREGQGLRVVDVVEEEVEVALLRLEQLRQGPLVNVAALVKAIFAHRRWECVRRKRTHGKELVRKFYWFLSDHKKGTSNKQVFLFPFFSY